MLSSNPASTSFDETTALLSLPNFSASSALGSTSSSSTLGNVSFDPLSSDFPPTADAWFSAALSESHNYVFESHATLQPMVNRAPVPQPATSMTPVPGSPEGIQQRYFQRFGEARFRKHAPEWINGDWLPHYEYTATAAGGTAATIWDVWVEWAEGVSGFEHNLGRKMAPGHPKGEE